jgi:hypothetical protein
VPGIAGAVAESATGGALGAADGAGLGVAAACFGQLGLDAAFLGADLLAAALREGFAFCGAAFATFFATLRAVPDFLALAFTLVFTLAFAFTFALEGWAFFFATLFLAAGRLAFATERFFDLLFFAMVNLLLAIVRTRCESSPEKVCCHLCMRLESVTRIA